MELALKNQAPDTQQKQAKEVGIPRPNAVDIKMASQFGLIMLNDASGTITFRDGATELTVYGIDRSQLPAIGTVVKLWGISLEEGEFFLSHARCISHGSGILANSATFLQLVVPSNQAVSIPRPDAIDINIASEFGLIMVSNASGTITFREGATELTVYGIPKEKLPEVGMVVKIWGISLETEEGRFFLPNAKCTGHGSGILDGSATFLQLVVPPGK